ncbi:MAG: FtsQ-type POTRA domain-containing protein [Polyangiaceae bacterium]|nr:FtsQ-type POTRA domain-containing protein [Polyangiaceae bacterium]
MKQKAPQNRRVARPMAPVADDAPPPLDEPTEAPARPRVPWRVRLRPLLTGARLALGAAVFLSTAGATSYGLYRYVGTSARFRVARITVEGAKRRSDEAVARTAGVAAGANVFSIDLDAARRQLLADPWIERAEVRRKLPGTIAISVGERQPISIVTLGGVPYLAATSGRVFKRLEPGDPDDLVVISGVGGEGEMLRDRASVERTVQRAQELAAAWEQANAPRAFSLQEAHVGKDGTMSIIVGRDPVVLSLGKPPFREKLARAARVLTEIERRKAQASIVFLDNEAHPERVVARMR